MNFYIHWKKLSEDNRKKLNSKLQFNPFILLIFFQIELTTLKTNNARLTSALQESTANVDEWKRQLQLYKEENARVKAKYADLEANKISEGNTEALRLRVEALENELRTRNEEIKALSIATKNKDYSVRIIVKHRCETPCNN